MLIESFVILVITFSFWLEASIGFGGGLVSVPLLAVFLTTSQAITLVMLFQFMKGALIFFNWKNVDWQAFWKIAVGVVIGCIFGVLLQSYLPQKIISLLLGGLVLLYVMRTRVNLNIGKSFIKRIPKWLVGRYWRSDSGEFWNWWPHFCYVL